MIKRNNLSIGCWITIPSNDVVEILCKSGFDWLAIDLEHSSITYSQAQDLIRIISLYGLKTFVRLSSNFIPRPYVSGGSIYPSEMSIFSFSNKLLFIG